MIKGNLPRRDENLLERHWETQLESEFGDPVVVSDVESDDNKGTLLGIWAG